MAGNCRPELNFCKYIYPVNFEYNDYIGTLKIDFAVTRIYK